MKMWTKEEINTVLNLWETDSKEEIAVKLGRNINSINNMANQIRAIDKRALPRKHRKGQVGSLIREVLASR